MQGEFENNNQKFASEFWEEMERFIKEKFGKNQAELMQEAVMGCNPFSPKDLPKNWTEGVVENIKQKSIFAIQELDNLPNTVRSVLRDCLRLSRTKAGIKFPYEIPHKLTAKAVFQCLLELTNLMEFRGKEKYKEGLHCYISTFFAFLEALEGDDFSFRYQEATTTLILQRLQELEEIVHAFSSDPQRLVIPLPTIPVKTTNQWEMLVKQVLGKEIAAVYEGLGRFFKFMEAKSPEGWPDDEKFRQIVDEYLAPKRDEVGQGQYL